MNKNQVEKYQKMFKRLVAAGKSEEFALEAVINSVWQKATNHGFKEGCKSVEYEKRQIELDDFDNPYFIVD